MADGAAEAMAALAVDEKAAAAAAAKAEAAAKAKAELDVKKEYYAKRIKLFEGFKAREDAKVRARAGAPRCRAGVRGRCAPSRAAVCGGRRRLRRVDAPSLR